MTGDTEPKEETMDLGTRPTANEVKAMLGLEPHPTCGFVAETYRSPLRIPAGALPEAYEGDRPYGSALYFLVAGSMRPVPEMGYYRSPVENVYLCGSGSHPGPGVSMAPGRNAAQTIFSDLGLDFGATVATGATRS
jgi:predicted cupin superfamily sugar epimerase